MAKKQKTQEVVSPVFKGLGGLAISVGFAAILLGIGALFLTETLGTKPLQVNFQLKVTPVKGK